MFAVAAGDLEAAEQVGPGSVRGGLEVSEAAGGQFEFEVVPGLGLRDVALREPDLEHVSAGQGQGERFGGVLRAGFTTFS